MPSIGEAHVPRRVVIVGGGFSGASIAVQLVRASKAPLHITIIDPAERAGRGLAYRAIDPDHRLNASSYAHSLLPDDAWHFSRWCKANGLSEQDPQALWEDGGVYFRRSDFGRYIEETLQAHASWPATGSTISHLRDQAVDLSSTSQPLRVKTAGGHELVTDLLFIATGNPFPRLQRPFEPGLATHPAVIENALDTHRLYEIAPTARVLLIGSGLTALDVLSTLVRRRHSGEIVVVSRRGLRPKPQGPMPAALAQTPGLTATDTLPGAFALSRINGPAPDFLTRAGVPATARAWLHALRAQIAKVSSEGVLWHQAFDEMRDAVWRLWPTLPAPEKRRFLRQLRSWYDVHRYRSPPQNQALVDTAVAEGRIRFIAARLKSVSAADQGPAVNVSWRLRDEQLADLQRFDAVINCTGLDALAALAANSFLQSATRHGWLRRDACSLGFEVDDQCCAVGPDGSVFSKIRVVGPPTVGSFGDPIGAMYIAAQIHRILPGILDSS